MATDERATDAPDFGVVCGPCGGGVYMETCGRNGGPDPECIYAVAGECQQCGERNEFGCPEHPEAKEPTDGEG